MALIGAALLLPVWLVRYPPLLDYPNHLARSFVLAHLNDPAFHFRGFYRAEWGPYPYLGMDLALVTLQRVLPAEVAGKVFLSLCVLAVPLAAWWFVRQANPGHDGLAFWGLLLAYNTFFLEGFLNFQLGLSVLLRHHRAVVALPRTSGEKAMATGIGARDGNLFCPLDRFCPDRIRRFGIYSG